MGQQFVKTKPPYALSFNLQQERHGIFLAAKSHKMLPLICGFYLSCRFRRKQLVSVIIKQTLRPFETFSTSVRRPSLVQRFPSIQPILTLAGFGESANICFSRAPHGATVRQAKAALRSFFQFERHQQGDLLGYKVS